MHGTRLEDNDGSDNQRDGKGDYSNLWLTIYAFYIGSNKIF